MGINEVKIAIAAIKAAPDNKKAIDTLEKILKNILTHPSEAKYRKLKVAGKVFTETLLPVDGACDFLYSLGFTESEDGAWLQVDELNSDTKTMFVHAVFLLKTNQSGPSSAPLQGTAESPTPPTPTPVQPSPTSQNRNRNLHKFNGSFLDVQERILRLRSSAMSHVRQWEDPETQKKVRETIPVTDLFKRASELLEQNADTEGFERGELLKHSLLVTLTDWFKNEFFKWTDGNIVRYNNPEKLLETREGRCGEWANCFGAILRSFAFHVRETYNVLEDHVWVEVRTPGRWTHVDPCEDAIDKPLMYKYGWKRNCHLCLSFSVAEGVRDTTWRYNNKLDEVREARKQLVIESWMTSFIKEYEEKKAKVVNWEKKMQEEDWIKEAVEFLSPKPVTDQKFSGRTTGSLQWRTSRGETLKNVEATVIEVKEDSPEFVVRYNCAKDNYSIDGETFTNWASFAHHNGKIFRKEEKDWKMCYLAMLEDSTGDAEVEFKFKLPKKRISSISVTAHSATYENGKVFWKFCSGDSCTKFNPSEQFVFNDPSPDSILSIKASLTAPNFWQHAQLFRQALDDDSFMFEVRFKF
ncbi:Oidioi.mRNA.OKI2018_I69.PAR.g10416.t1.cds [Oikopleura dioica]|uniref:Peptide-N(4)-(N-acetyl-beta-glucosaminyl)asparagine amidase n=1 Tax=Oikopleura dioica TaxID=34765 RepID=A0ABN7RVP8_OIKDI|nr:Oidioi.mRNA.OKI2018_I69.PAR.g10416.t1.cds [Oikopleura dioica]